MHGSLTFLCHAGKEASAGLSPAWQLARALHAIDLDHSYAVVLRLSLSSLSFRERNVYI